jgi:hypothetical protein
MSAISASLKTFDLGAKLKLKLVTTDGQSTSVSSCRSSIWNSSDFSFLSDNSGDFYVYVLCSSLTRG